MNWARDYLRRLWGPWWPVPGIVLLCYLAALLLLHGARPEHYVVIGLAFVLAYGHSGLQRFFINFSPFLIFAIGYDLFRFVGRLFDTPDRILACQLQKADEALFPAGHGLSLQEWLTHHASVPLDIISAVPYTIHVHVAIIYGVFLYFKDRPRMRYYLIAVALANYTAMVIWAIWPSAPPWYVHAHGCNIDMGVASSAAGLLRVDALLGIPYYHEMYARNSSVFAALPSMHNGFAMLGLLSAWPYITWRTRPIHLLYAGTMFFASLYLDHHWIVDALAGWLIAAVAVFGSRRLLAQFGRAPSKMVQGESGGAG